ncbi:MAG: MFS transporter [Verrucomicrobia bacterium]|nr:MFS transporter [Verrucomicrobiota bacterium]
MALFIWSSVTYTFISLVVSTLILQVYTLQEGKKLFGIIGGFRAVGGIISGFLIPYLVRSIGSNTVFLLAPIFIFGALGVLFLIYQSRKERFEEKRDEQKESVSFKGLKNKTYTLLIFAVAVVSIFNYFSTDLMFNTQVKKQFLTQTEIASFLGVFTAVSNLLNLIGGFFLFRFILEKLGLIVTLFLSPVVVGGLVALAIIADWIPVPILLASGIFYFAILMEKMLRTSVNTESLSLLYAPLKPAERKWAQLQYRINIQSLSTSVIGLILLGISLLVGISIPSVGLFVIATSICGVMIMLMIKRDYVKVLVGALEKWALYKPELSRLDKDTLTILKGRLKSPYPDEVIFILQTIEKSEPSDLPKLFEEALDNTSAEVRLYVLKQIEKKKITQALEKVKALSSQEKDLKVRGQAVRTLGAISTIESGFSVDPNPEIVISSLIARILYGSDTIKREAIQHLNSTPKLITAQVLQEVEISDKADRLLPLLTDSDTEVRIAASLAAKDVKEERLYPLLIENLTIAPIHYAASKTLMEDAPIGYIRDHFGQFSRRAQVEVLYLLGRISGDEALAFLKTFLASENRQEVQAALRALKKQGYVAENRDQIAALLASENHNIVLLKPTIENLHQAPIIRDLLIREVEMIQESIFILLTFIYPAHPILSAKEGLLSSDRNKMSYAVEVLLELLSKEDAENLIPQLAYRPSEAKAGPEPIEEALKKVVDYAPRAFITAMTSAVIYTIGALKIHSMMELVQKEEAPQDPLISEIRPWALEELSRK